MNDVTICHKCSGDGWTTEPECCHRPGDECCGMPVPAQVQCQWCGGTGRVPITPMSE